MIPDWTEVLQQAINAAATADEGSVVVVLPNGTYCLTNRVATRNVRMSSTDDAIEPEEPTMDNRIAERDRSRWAQAMTPTEVTAAVQFASDHVEGVSVFVVTDDADMARAVGPLLAATLYPGDTYSDVLHVERIEDIPVSGFEVVVRVHRGGSR